jgi:hypothetical protein
MQTTSAPSPTSQLFEHGHRFSDFVASVTAQREVWHRNTAQATVPAELIDRFRRVSPGLQILIVAEDWCPDSVYTVPYIARLADSAKTELRIVDRQDGAEIMRRHPASDGRSVTPTVVLLRRGIDVGAWVERPAPLQRMFQSLADPDSARQFADRERWYAADRGRTTLAEFVDLAERRNSGTPF